MSEANEALLRERRPDKDGLSRKTSDSTGSLVNGGVEVIGCEGKR